MKSKYTISIFQFTRQLTAILLSVLLIPAVELTLIAQDAPPAEYAPMDAVQLDQLIAPIALYPDSLIAQILTASTYPDQITDANNWLQQNMGLPPEQRADIANGMPWDPSVKALTAFPSVLDNLARNYDWSSQLGNAYYNQPDDVMDAVQAMRYQAQESGVLRSTPQQRVYDDNGVIVIAPVNEGMVYVPYYNPWRVWGPTFGPYPGYYVMPPPSGVALGVGIGFAAGISIGLFAHFGWGYSAWAPNWRGGGVIYNNDAYYSRSETVRNRGHFGGFNRGAFEREGRGVPSGYRAPVARERFNSPETRSGGRPGAQPEVRPAAGPEARPGNRPGAQPEVRPAAGPEARPGNRPGAQPESRPAAGPEARPGNSPGAQPESRPAAGPEARPGNRPGAQPEVRPAAGPEARPGNRPGAQPESRPAAGPEGRLGNRPGAQPEGRPAARPEAPPANPPEARPAERPQPTRGATPQPAPRPGNSDRAPAAQPRAEGHGNGEHGSNQKQAEPDSHGGKNESDHKN